MSHNFEHFIQLYDFAFVVNLKVLISLMDKAMNGEVHTHFRAPVLLLRFLYISGNTERGNKRRLSVQIEALCCK